MQDREEDKRSVAFVSYAAFTIWSGRVFVNRPLGQFVDTIAPAFSAVHWIAQLASPRSPLYVGGKPIYSYSPRAANVRIHPLLSSAEATGASQRIRSMVSNREVVNRVLAHADWAHVFLPSYQGMLAGFACKRRKLPYSVYVGSDWEETGPLRIATSLPRTLRQPAFRVYRALDRRIVRSSEFVLTAGTRLAETYRNLNPNVQPTVPLLQLRTDEPRPNRNLNPRRVELLYVGRLDKEKGTGDLVEALGLLPSGEREAYRLTLVGAGDRGYLSHLRSLVDDPDRLEIHGYVNDPDELRSYYSSADLFVFPSRGEGFPRVLYEAMCVDLPVIASDIPSIRGNLPDPSAVEFFDPGQPASLSTCIRRVAHDAGRRQEMISAGSRLIDGFKDRSPATQFLELMESCNEG